MSVAWTLKRQATTLPLRRETPPAGGRLLFPVDHGAEEKRRVKVQTGNRFGNQRAEEESHNG